MSDASGAVAREIVHQIIDLYHHGYSYEALSMRLSKRIDAECERRSASALDQAFAAGEAKGLRDGQASMRAEEEGATPAGSGLSPTAEPQGVSGLTAFDPSRMLAELENHRRNALGSKHISEHHDRKGWAMYHGGRAEAYEHAAQIALGTLAEGQDRNGPGACPSGPARRATPALPLQGEGEGSGAASEERR